MAARQFGVSLLLASRWSQITDSTTKNMNFQALFEVQEMFVFVFVFLYGRFAIHRSSLYSIRFNASVSHLTTRMIDCSL